VAKVVAVSDLHHPPPISPKDRPNWFSIVCDWLDILASTYTLQKRISNHKNAKSVVVSPKVKSRRPHCVERRKSENATGFFKRKNKKVTTILFCFTG
jgi:hypothetical protein